MPRRASPPNLHDVQSDRDGRPMLRQGHAQRFGGVRFAKWEGGVKRNISQPESWWEAFEHQAAAEGKTLSAWLGEAGKAKLPREIAKKLTDRPPANRPRKETKYE